jgi:ketosteroid isomerase-like protein
MTQQIAFTFIEALSVLEQDGELEPIIATFGDSCEIQTWLTTAKLHGKEGARVLWSHYKSAFRQVHATFRNIVVDDDRIALEWTAAGVDRFGKEIHYDGVSILDTAETSITRFRTYFDSGVGSVH